MNTMKEPVSYEIKTINDFFKVPADRRAVMFSEIETAVRRTEEIIAQKQAELDVKFKAMPKWMQHGLVYLFGKPVLKPVMRGFCWTDDGKRLEKITITGLGRNVVVHETDSTNLHSEN